MQIIKNWLHSVLSLAYSAKYGFPHRQIKVIGVTGTDGKTTTSRMIYHLLQSAGHKVGLVTTLNAVIDDEVIDTGTHTTTPKYNVLHKLLKSMVERGVEYVIIETTSHALAQGRVNGIVYDAAIFTNITQDHLDYHKTFENYRAAKAKLIRKVKSHGFVVLNKDDSNYDFLKTLVPPRKLYTYSLKSKDSSTFVLDRKKSDQASVSSHGSTIDIVQKLPGDYNLLNLLGAITIAKCFGMKDKAIIKAANTLPANPGRWEIIQTKPFKVIVDYAHTANALAQVIKTAHAEIAEMSKVVLLFGLSGGRDQVKREQMAAEAANADEIIITSVDWNGEEPQSIINELHSRIIALQPDKSRNLHTVLSREDAIAKAISLASQGDIVLICGKGHEDKLEIAPGQEIDWSDAKIAKQKLKS